MLEPKTVEAAQPDLPVETAPVAAIPQEVVEVDNADEGFDFDGLNNSIEESMVDDPESKTPVAETSEVKAPVVEAPVVAPATPASPSADLTPPVVAPAPVAEATPAVQPTPVSETPGAAAPASQQASPQAEDGFTALDRAIEAGREDLIKAVAQKVYQLPAEELEAVQTEPEVAIPKLLARVHVNTVQGVIRHVAQQMPAMVGALMQAQAEYGKREEQFFSQWPQLDRTKHRDQILQVGQVFRQVNPNATLEDFIKHVGAQVVLMNGLHAQQPQRAAMPVSQPVAPAYVPAGAGRQSNPAPAPDNNPWAEMVEVMNE